MSSQSRHILLVTSEFPPQPGGIGNHAYNMALFMARASNSVTVLTDQRSVDGDVERKFDAEQPFEVVRIKRRKWRSLMYVNRIINFRKLLKETDVVLASGKFSLWMVAWSKRASQKHRIAIVHGSEVNYSDPKLNASIQKSLDRFDQIVAVSNFTAGLLNQEVDKITVIPNGIDISAWNINSDTSNLKGNPILITVGRLSERKGQMTMIKHLPKIVEHYPEAHYHCIGIPQNSEDYLRQAQDLNVGDHLTIHGTLDGAKLQSALKTSDIFIMLSQETESGDVEGFGIAILEANAMGKPAIGSSAMGIPDAIDDGNSGMLVNASSSEELVRAIDRIIDNKERFDQCAREWAVAHDWSEIVKKYLTLIP